MPGKPRFWLMKSEPSVYSIHDLQRDGKTFWDGVRNYQARNFIRDEMKMDDTVLFYHSNADPTGIAGLARVCREAYPDFTALDPKNAHYDPKSTADDPRWFMVDIAYLDTFEPVITLQELRQQKALQDLLVLRRGMRLSVQPVSAEQFDRILQLRPR
ncbi:EVE domain-containing protein [candidate division KSB1 bacterium]|nr:EVE domain-containing protein [candidate division KSB1 bacterium]